MTTDKVRVTRLKIVKFRAIREATIELRDVVALVGQNGSGKSTVLRALNAFFNFDDEREDFEAGSHSYARNAQTVIEVTIDGLQCSETLVPCQQGGQEIRSRLKFNRQPKWECFSAGKWRQAPPGFHQALREQISYALVPARRDHAVAHNASHGLLERAVQEWVRNGRQRDRVSPKIAQLGSSLMKNSLVGFERQLEKVTPLEGPFSFELRYASPPDYRMLLANLELSVREGGQPIPLSDSGSGTQSMAIFALYAYLAEVESKSFLLGFEEPEQNLHPQAQRQLMNSLIKLGLQVIFTTHSPTIVDSLDHEQVVLCRRTTGTPRGLDVQIAQISHDFFQKNGLDRAGYYKFHRRKNSEFMFADFVVVTESPIDAAVVSVVLEDANCPPAESGISFIALDGVESIDHMFHLLRALEIPCAFVIDKDYFLPYQVGNERSRSLNSGGYPQYGSTAKNRTLLRSLFPKDSERAALISQLASNHSQAMVRLRAVGFFCFRYSLEVDLVAAAEPRSRLFEYLKVAEPDRTERQLLVEKHKQLKQQDALITAVAGLPPRSLPNSYKSLRRELPKMVSDARGKSSTHRRGH